MTILTERKDLPFRKTTDGFLLYQGKIVAQDRGHYLHFPGGGLAPKETALEAQKRESYEETGAIVQNLKVIKCITWIWGPTWAQTPNQKRRYAQYQGEMIHLVYGEVNHFVTPQKNQDTWQGEQLMPLEEAITKAAYYYDHALPNEKRYKYCQWEILLQIAAGKISTS